MRTTAIALLTLVIQAHDHASPDRMAAIAAALALKPGAVIADVGADGGDYTVKLSPLVGPSGKVLAVDVSPVALARLRARVAADGLANVHVIEGTIEDPRLPQAAVDAVLIVNAYHEMTAFASMLNHIRASLKPAGRLVILEPISARNRTRSRAEQTADHNIAPELVLADVKAAGFDVVALQDPFTAGDAHDTRTEWMLVATPSSPTLPRRTDPEPGVDANAARLPFEEFLQLQKTGRVIVLDTRDPDSYANGHVPGARLAPISTLRDLAAELRAARDPIVAYCACPAEETSLRAVGYLQTQGVAGVRALTGGWERWVKEKLPVQTGTRPSGR